MLAVPALPSDHGGAAGVVVAALRADVVLKEPVKFLNLSARDHAGKIGPGQFLFIFKADLREKIGILLQHRRDALADSPLLDLLALVVEPHHLFAVDAVLKLLHEDLGRRALRADRKIMLRLCGAAAGNHHPVAVGDGQHVLGMGRDRQEGILEGHIFGFPEILSRIQQGRASVALHVILGALFRVMEGLLADLPDHFASAHALFQPAPLLPLGGRARMDDVARGVKIGRIRVILQVQDGFNVLVVYPAAFRKGVHDLDIDRHAGHLRVGEVIAVDRSFLGIDKMIDRHGDIRIKVHAADHDSLGQTLFGCLKELRPVVPGHNDIRIVVPGHEALVADRADQRSAEQKVVDFVLPADLVDILKERQ